jgi:L-alanine-DL-glutamate epimerase-like enolase superfamily enzyme
MKIRNVTAIPVRTPIIHGGPPSGFGGTTWDALQHVLVRVDTDEGVTGWGEAFGFNVAEGTATVVRQLVAPLAVGRDPIAIRPLMEDLFRKLHLFGRYGVTMFALSGLDIALWDIAGKVAGQPLHRLLGGAGRARVPAYSSLIKYGDPAVVARLAEDAAARGYCLVKLHESGVAEVEAARRAVGDGVPIMVDVNCSWPPGEAVAMARRMRPFNLHWLEEPVWPPEDFAGLARVRREGGVPVAAGENACTAWEFKRLLDCGAVDLAQPSVTKVGGISEFLKVVDLATLAGAGLAPHSPYFGPGLIATVHLAAARPEVESVEVFGCRLEVDMFGEVDLHRGDLLVPDGPGLGVDLDPAFLKRYVIS